MRQPPGGRGGVEWKQHEDHSPEYSCQQLFLLLPTSTLGDFHLFVEVFHGKYAILLVQDCDGVQFGWDATRHVGLFGVSQVDECLNHSMLGRGDIIRQREVAHSPTLKGIVFWWGDDPGIPANLFEVDLEGGSPAIIVLSSLPPPWMDVDRDLVVVD